MRATAEPERAHSDDRAHPNGDGLMPPVLQPKSRFRARQRTWWRPQVLWTVYQYFTVEVIRIFLLGILAVSLLYTALAAYQTVRSGLQLSFVWPLLTKTFAYPLYYSIPVAFLFAVTLALGRMVSDLEISALRTHGVSYGQLATPILLLGGLLCALSVHLNGWVIPEIHYEKRNLQAYILKQLENLGSGVNRTLLLPDEAGTLWVGEYDGTDLWRIDIDLKIEGRASILPEIRGRLPERLPSKIKILAREGKLELSPDRTSVILKLREVDVLVPEPVRESAVANERFHQKFTISKNVVIPISFAPKSPGLKDRTQTELRQYIGELREDLRRLRIFEKENLAYASHNPDKTGAWRARSVGQLRRRIAAARTEFYRRLGFSLSCLTLPLVGIAVALLVESWSRLVPFFLANLVVIGVFYPLLMVGVSLGKSDFLPPLAMILPNVAVLALGVFLMRKVVRR